METKETEARGSAFRLDVPLHNLLTQPATAPPPGLLPVGAPQSFPDPVSLQRPDLLGPVSEGDNFRPPEKRHRTSSQIYYTTRGWLFPYIRSRITPGDFHPLIAYLFTEIRCNLDCRYCWAFDSKVKSMTEDTVDYFLRRYREDIIARHTKEQLIETRLAAFECSLRKQNRREEDYELAVAGD